MEEIWKDIEGYEGLYQVSNLGRVKSLNRDHQANSRWGKTMKRVIKEKLLKEDKTGRYLRVSLSKNGIKQRFSINRLVAQAFIPNIKNKPQVNHKDGNRDNNQVENLEWCTAKENMQHARSNNLITNIPIGENHPSSKLSKKNAIKIKKIAKIGTRSRPGNINKLAKEYGVNRVTITDIVHQKTWKHI